MSNIKDIKQMDPITHSVRRSQAVLQYGVGAMIDFPSQVLMTALPEEWKNPDTIHDERLEKLLGVQRFITPSENSGVPFVRFPRWYFCPKCRRFQPIEDWQKEYAQKGKRKGDDKDTYMLQKLKCSSDGQELVPARIVVVCEHGHIDDFPWVNWVHRKKRFGESDVCASPHLLFKTGTSASSGLEGVEIECTTCGAKASLFGAFNKDAFQEAEEGSKFNTSFRCTGNHPWKHEREGCGLYPRAMQRGAASVYFPRTISSLVIPPYSSMLTSKVENADNFKALCSVWEYFKRNIKDEDALRSQTIELIEQYKQSIADEIYEDVEGVRAVLNRRLMPSNQDNLEEDVELKYKAEEYKALTGKIAGAQFERDEFLREGVDAGLYSIKGVKSIALIHKVKEVTALIGFSRIDPANAMSSDEDERFVSVKRDKTDFYPASVSRGEGIFIEFDKAQLSAFYNTEKIKAREAALNTKYANSFYGRNKKIKITSEFVFIHTLAHLLIKELSFYCGYPTASIRERIYYGTASDEDMCGILLYTTGGDAEGTLGGLVRQGYPDCLPGIFKRALQGAKFCANDPVCSFSDGQGIEALNYAACHACTLLPETCCEYSNVLLDRTLVVGNMDNSIKGFYSEEVNG